jgi:hypothetical protein
LIIRSLLIQQFSFWLKNPVFPVGTPESSVHSAVGANEFAPTELEMQSYNASQNRKLTEKH